MTRFWRSYCTTCRAGFGTWCETTQKHQTFFSAVAALRAYQTGDIQLAIAAMPKSTVFLRRMHLIAYKPNRNALIVNYYSKHFSSYLATI
jgi:hypothetical protein